MKTLFLNLVFLTSAATCFAKSDEVGFKCVPKAKAQSLWSYFTFRTNHPSYLKTFEPCNERSPFTKVIASLIFIKEHAKLPHVDSALDQNILGEDAWKFLVSRINTIEFETNENHTCGETYRVPGGKTGAAAFVRYYKPTMHICDHIADYPVPLIAGMLIHEARHTEGFRHTTCIRGIFKSNGAPACDASVTTEGAYAVEVEYSLRMLARVDFDQEIRDLLKYDVNRNLANHFNIAPAVGLPSSL